MDEPVLLVRNRKGAYHTVNLSHYREHKDRDGFEIVDEREWLLAHHQLPETPTVRAASIPDAGEPAQAPVQAEAVVPGPELEEQKPRRGRKPRR